MTWGEGVSVFAAFCFAIACVLSLCLHGFTTEVIALWAAAQASITSAKVSRMERQKGLL